MLVDQMVIYNFADELLRTLENQNLPQAIKRNHVDIFRFSRLNMTQQMDVCSHVTAELVMVNPRRWF